jgi:phosphate transport system substrate-binding protein
MTHLKLGASALAVAAIAASGAFAQSRNQIRIVGSSTVFPYTQAVAEEFANQGFTAPVVESTGTGGGFQIFCAGVGVGHPDITGASRAIRKSEFDLCAQNGVTDITEALIGYDGLSIAISRKNTALTNLTLEQVYLALAQKVPVNGEWADNPYKRWSEIDASLPDLPIVAYGPPPTSGTRDAFVELAMHAGCEELQFVKDGGFDGDWVGENCSAMRQDGPFIEAGENDNLIVQRLEADPNAVGIFGYSFLFENLDKLRDVNINGVEANAETIASFEYPIARPLYFYVKNAHRGVIPGMNEFIAEYASDNALGDGGYLQERGLVVLADDVRTTLQDNLLNAVTMDPVTE